MFLFLNCALSVYTLLIISELFWITLYTMSLLFAVVDDNLLILSLSLFFLMFSAVEISVGLTSFFVQLKANLSLSIESVKIPETFKLATSSLA